MAVKVYGMSADVKNDDFALGKVKSVKMANGTSGTYSFYKMAAVKQNSVNGFAHSNVVSSSISNAEFQNGNNSSNKNYQ